MSKDGYTLRFSNSWEEDYAIRYVAQTDEAWIAKFENGETSQVFIVPLGVLEKFLYEVRSEDDERD